MVGVDVRKKQATIVPARAFGEDQVVQNGSESGHLENVAPEPLASNRRFGYEKNRFFHLTNTAWTEGVRMIDHGLDFKQAMRRLASTITLITSGRGDGRTGMAATAVMSVTADPPTLLIAVNKTASLHAVVCETSAFCVNLLGAAHHALVPIFSGAVKGTGRFDHGDWRYSRDGPPVLNDAVASLVCAVTNRMDIGTHSIFIGEVREIDNHPRIDPLLWVDGALARAQSPQAISGGL